MKKAASEKRAALPRSSDVTKTFANDWKRHSRSGRFDMPRLRTLMMLLLTANDAPLAAEWKDHPLTGAWKDCRECHVHGDFLLIYRIDGDTVVFLRAGTHADLFE